MLSPYKWLRRDLLHVCNEFPLLSYILLTQQKQSSKVFSALESTLEGSSVINLLWNSLDNLYEVSVVVVTATTLLLKWCAWVHNWASRKHLWGAKLISQAGYSRDYGEKYHFYCLNGCPAWHHWWRIKGNLISRQGWQQMEITRLQDVSQLCTKQVGTREVFK